MYFKDSEEFIQFTIKSHIGMLPCFFNQGEYLETMNKLTFLKKLITLYSNNNAIDIRIIINTVIILHNGFGSNTQKILFYSISSEYHSIVKSLLCKFDYYNSDDETSDININEEFMFNLNKELGDV